ncbi:MAG TPA: cytochrome c [Candidatus Dormibacteraeota bacterium]|nr:cytochrome c [Candidatus Dormibacteraeota bacterium]
MRLKRSVGLPALLAITVPGLLALTAITTLADSSPSPTVALPGDPVAGAAVYAANCTSCHGGSLEGGIGAVLNPIDKMPGVANPLDPAFLIDIITNGRVAKPGDPRSANMPAKGGATTLTDQNIKDVAAFIIQQNMTGVSPPLTPGELAKRTILWVSVGIIAMVFITYLLAQYNMRWIARRAAARRK